MTQDTRHLEKRLERVEKELANLKAVLRKKALPWYRQIVGDYSQQDPALAEILRLGRLIRQGKIKG